MPRPTRAVLKAAKKAASGLKDTEAVVRKTRGPHFGEKYVRDFDTVKDKNAYLKWEREFSVFGPLGKNGQKSRRGDPNRIQALVTKTYGPNQGDKYLRTFPSAAARDTYLKGEARKKAARKAVGTD